MKKIISVFLFFSLSISASDLDFKESLNLVKGDKSLCAFDQVHTIDGYILLGSHVSFPLKSGVNTHQVPDDCHYETKVTLNDSKINFKNFKITKITKRSKCPSEKENAVITEELSIKSSKLQYKNNQSLCEYEFEK